MRQSSATPGTKGYSSAGLEDWGQLHKSRSACPSGGKRGAELTIDTKCAMPGSNLRHPSLRRTSGEGDCHDGVSRGRPDHFPDPPVFRHLRKMIFLTPLKFRPPGKIVFFTPLKSGNSEIGVDLGHLAIFQVDTIRFIKAANSGLLSDRPNPDAIIPPLAAPPSSRATAPQKQRQC